MATQKTNAAGQHGGNHAIGGDDPFYATAQAAIDALTAVSGATNEHVLTKDTTTGNAIWKAAASGGSNWTDGGAYLKPVTDGDTIRAYDSGGTEYAELQHDVLLLQERSAAPSQAANKMQIYPLIVAGYGTDATGSGSASASSVEGVYAASLAVDNTLTGQTGWLSGLNPSFPVTWSYDFGEGVTKTITKYRIALSVDWLIYAPKTWTFKGSNNGSDWTTLDTQTDVTSWATDTYKDYTFTNVTGYRYYRINISVGNSTARVSITELELINSQSTYALKVMYPDGTEKTVTLT